MLPLLSLYELLYMKLSNATIAKLPIVHLDNHKYYTKAKVDLIIAKLFLLICCRSLAIFSNHHF